MKQLLFSIICIATISCASAQDYDFSKTYDRFEGDEARPITSEVTLDLGLITISNSLDFGVDGGVILRTNPDGTIKWEKKYYGPDYPNGIYFNDVATMGDSSYIVSGQIREDGSTEFFPFCMKLNDDGDTLWTETFDFSTALVGDYGNFLSLNTHLTTTSDSSILMVWQHSSFEDFPTNPDHLCVSKVSSDGNIIWSNSMIVDSTFFATDIVENLDQSIYVIGNTENTNGSGYCVHLTSAGLFDWAKKFDDVVFREAIVDSTGFALSWLNNSLGQTGIMKFDSAGVNTKRVGFSGWISEIEPSFDRRWNGNYLFSQKGDNFGGGIFFEVQSALNSADSYMPYMIVKTLRDIPNYGIYAVGYGPMYGVKSDNNQIGISRLDSLMSTQFWCVLPANDGISEYSLITSQDVFFADAETIIGFNITVNPAPTTSDTEDGCVTFYGSIDENEGSWNETVSPNPSAGEFTISWGDYRDAEIVVYNSIGMEIYRTNAKSSFVEIDIKSESEGLFYYKLLDRDGSQSSGKLMILK